MPATLTAIDDALKIDYRPYLREQLNNATYFLLKVQKNKDNYTGRKAELKLHIGRNVGTGARREGVTLPSAGNQQYDTAEFLAKYNYARIKVTGPAIAATKSKVGSIVKVVDSEVKGAERDLKVDVNRQLWHDGSSILTRAKNTGAGTTVEVESTKFLQKDLEIEIRKITDGTIPANTGFASGVVSSITDADTFVSSVAIGSSGLDNTFAVIKLGSRTAASWGTHDEMWGLEAAISDANPGNGITDLFGTITRTGSVIWDANVLANGGTNRALTLRLMQEAWDQTEIQGDAVPGLLLSNHAILRVYGNLLVADKRFSGDLVELDGGYSGLKFNGAPFVADKDASKTLTPQQLNRIYFLTMSTMSLEVLEEWDWMDQDGAVLSRVSGEDAYEATFKTYMELACDRPNANCVLDDLAES